MNAEKRINLYSFGLIYFFLFAITVFLNESNPFLKFPKFDDFFWKKMVFDMGLGCVVGCFVVLISWVLTNRSKSFQELMKSFCSLLGPLTVSDIFFIAAFSSLAEEFFFRGLIQAKMGLIFSSFLFGALHTGPGKKYIPWTIFAVIMGLVLGGLYEWSGNLILPVVVHFVINFVNLQLMQNSKLFETSNQSEK